MIYKKSILLFYVMPSNIISQGTLFFTGFFHFGQDLIEHNGVNESIRLAYMAWKIGNHACTSVAH